MTLEVIGSGPGRTGTMSLQFALNRLGLGPCYHMREVRPDQLDFWINAGAGDPDWDSIFQGYRSALDYPSSAYWRQLAAHYPCAKVIHTVRDPDTWFESTQATIFNPGQVARPGTKIAAFKASFIEPGLRCDDRAAMIEFFLRNTEEVKAAFPPERLLVYDVNEGWEPLCRFLDLPIPDEPFPTINSRDELLMNSPSMFLNVLHALRASLEQAAAKQPDADLTDARLDPHGRPLHAECQMALDTAINTLCWLAGMDAPTTAHTRTDLAGLKERCDRTIAFIDSLDRTRLQGTSKGDVGTPAWDGPARRVDRCGYLIGSAVPTFISHVEAVYAILKNAGFSPILDVRSSSS